MGTFLHACEGEMTAIGKVDEILGPLNQVYFTIKPQEGIVATSFKSGDKFYIGGDKLLPLEKFLPRPKPPPGAPKPKRVGGASRGGPARGGRGMRGGGRGAPRGRGGFGDRGGRGGSGVSEVAAEALEVEEEVASVQAAAQQEAVAEVSAEEEVKLLEDKRFSYHGSWTALRAHSGLVCTADNHRRVLYFVPGAFINSFRKHYMR
ncbi:H/ACA snoRNP pseudouridylase subunit [Coniosporium tulheliwenetii]|uniref:H/ACA snoRNP pseudouridylase subunit n=1 Tax=Coniosporium tulheliwenetii TaxID=3383036 RepID=A0ACC2ZHR9_9PEZI|nr:H/ACA snoRNP pseudouridylase subunit [Cladosporium sp. JES 115]